MKSGYIAIVGRANVGKSTLLNKLIEEKLSIISDKSGTTRDKIVGITNKGEYQYIFIDTPGLQRPKNLLGEYMSQVALKSFEEADLILLILDATEKIDKGDIFAYNEIKKSNKPCIAIINKFDLITDKELEEKKEEIKQKLGEFNDIIFVSAKFGIGIHKIFDESKKYLNNDNWFYPEDYYTDVPINHMVIEIVREKILLLTEDEIPHSVAAEIIDIKSTKTSRTYNINIYVEKKSQKGIIIGENGNLIKKIGILAREDIEKLIDLKVNLILWVKLRKNWRKDKKFLEEMNYQ